MESAPVDLSYDISDSTKAEAELDSVSSPADDADSSNFIKKVTSRPLCLNILKIKHQEFLAYLTENLLPNVRIEEEFYKQSGTIIIQRFQMDWQDYADLFDIPEGTNPEADDIHILVDFCPLKEKFVEDIINGEIDVALIDTRPVFLKGFKGSRFVQNTGSRYNWRMSPSEYRPLDLCENIEFFEIISVGDKIKNEEECWDDGNEQQNIKEIPLNINANFHSVESSTKEFDTITSSETL